MRGTAGARRATHRAAATAWARRAFTLVEALMVVAIGGILILMIVQAHTRMTGMFGTASADLALQTDARILFDTLGQDLTHSILVSAGGDGTAVAGFEWKDKQPGQLLQIFRLKKDPRGRIVAPDAPDRPQYEGSPGPADSGEPAQHRWPAFRVVYKTEPDQGAGGSKLKVMRTETEGLLVRKEDVPKCEGEPAWLYSFEPKKDGRTQQMAVKVASFAILPLAFVPEPRPSPVGGGPPAPAPATSAPGPTQPEADLDRRLMIWDKSKPCAQLYQISALGVHYLAEDIKDYRMTVKAPVPTATTEGRVELVSKFWIEERSAAFRFPAAFSSIDEPL
jgi:hypothetical protein